MSDKQIIRLGIVLLTVFVLAYTAFFVNYTYGDEWTVTQYVDATGSQSMFYTLTKHDGTLVIIDGGWVENADQVRKVIRNHGGKVHTWILTHYHPDHCGALAELYPEMKDSIGQIWVTGLDLETFTEVAQPWDVPEIYQKYAEATAGADNIRVIQRGDTMDVGTLHFEFFNAWDDLTRETASDWPNNSSLVFKVTHRQESILFMGDVHQPAMGELLLRLYGAERLSAKYVQPGHHGNASMPSSFYDALSPEIMVFDAPEWLMVGEQWAAKDLKAWCDEKGIRVIDQSTAPNQWILR